MISVGSTEIANVCVGGTAASAVYVGSTLVWSAAAQPDEFFYDFTTKSLGSLDATTSDSGHVVACFGTRVGSVAASPKDGVKVFRQDAGSGATYLTPSTPFDSMVVYAKGEHRLVSSGSTTKLSALGVISFDRVDTGQDSATHIVVEEDRTYAQLVVNAGGFTTIGGPWAYADVGDAWCVTEWAILDDTLVIRTADGTVHSYTHSGLQTYGSKYPVFEPVKNASTDWQPEFRKVYAASMPHLIDNPTQLAYYNNLLAAGGVGPFVPQDPAAFPTLVGVGGSLTSSPVPNASFTAPDGVTPFTCAAGDLIVAMPYNDDSTTLPTAFTGYTSKKTQTGSACAGSLLSKVAAGGETSTGNAGSNTADQALVLIYRGASGVGNVTSTGSTGTPHTIPANTFTVTDGTSVAAMFCMRRNDGAPVPFTSVSNPEGPVAIRKANTTATGSGSNSQGAAYDTYQGVTGYAGGSVNTDATGYVSFTVEIKAS